MSNVSLSILCRVGCGFYNSTNEGEQFREPFYIAACWDLDTHTHTPSCAASLRSILSVFHHAGQSPAEYTVCMHVCCKQKKDCCLSPIPSAPLVFSPLPIMLDLTKYSSSRYCMPFHMYYILEFAPHKLDIVCVYSQI